MENSNYKITLPKIFKHLHLVNKHKWYVFKYCCKAGIPWRGLVHDLSKYSPTEFFDSVKYYTGTKHLLMPFEYALEMLCDYLGAARAYMGKEFTYKKEYDWYQKKKEQAKACHPVIREFIEIMLIYMDYKYYSDGKIDKNIAKDVYNALTNEYNKCIQGYDISKRPIELRYKEKHIFLVITIHWINGDFSTSTRGIVY